MKQVGCYIAFVVSLLLFGACGKGGCNVVPNVSFKSGVSQASHSSLFRPGGWTYANGGVCGLILYNSGKNVIAYDRCSTVDIGERNQVEVDGFQVIDKVSGAQWLLIDGSPAHIAECHLKPYHVSQVGNIYYVTN